MAKKKPSLPAHVEKICRHQAMPPLQDGNFKRMNFVTSTVKSNREVVKNRKRSKKLKQFGTKYTSAVKMENYANESKANINQYDYSDPVKRSRKEWYADSNNSFNPAGVNVDFVDPPVINYGCDGCCSISFYKFYDDFAYTKDEIIIN